MKTIQIFYSKWIKMKPLSFVFVTTFFSFILMIPIILVLIFFDISENEIGGIDYEKYSFWSLFFTAVIFAPIIETLFGQLLPIRITAKILKNKFRIVWVFISAILFSLMHFGYSIWYSLLTLPMGILLAKTFIVFQERKESSFWITTAVHSLRNLIGVIAIYYGME